MHRRIVFGSVLAMVLTACANTQVTQQDGGALAPGEAYLAFASHSLDNITSLRIEGFSRGTTTVIIPSVPKGESLSLHKVPEGKYCLMQFSVGDTLVRYRNGGVCFFVEQGEVNYPGHFFIRNPTTVTRAFPKDFYRLMQTQFPKICAEYFGDVCVKGDA